MAMVEAEAARAARTAALCYVRDDGPGIQRRRRGRGFSYARPDGRAVRDEQTLSRIRALAIPPAWTDVWICPLADGHIQATGRDARGRKQYRYHRLWREVRDETKYDRLLPFGRALPRIRARVDKDLALAGMPRQKILALIVRLLETTFLRVGNEEYVRSNGSYGLTTLLDEHVRIRDARISFRFRGKRGKVRTVHLTDRRLARLVKRCRDLPGQELFQYLEESGEPRQITSTDVNEYLRAAAGRDFTAKDFRTWAGTLLAARELVNGSTAPTRARKADIVRAAEAVAAQLGNTAAICRKCYIHPAVLEGFSHPSVRRLWSEARESGNDRQAAEERTLLRFLGAHRTRARES